MDELIKSLPKVLRALGNSYELAEAAAIAAWKHTAGDGLRPHAIATKLEGKTLVVEVRDTIWQKQLSTMKSQLLFRVNSVLGQPLLDDIDLRVNPKAVSLSKPQIDESAEILDNEVPIELWSAASSIDDKQLRQKFLKAAIGSLRRKGT
jgi:hypothetical protein